MSGATEGLKQVVQFLHPHTLARLREAGALDPKGPFAIARSFPWLIGRGPSLGVVSSMNAIVLGDKPALHDRGGTVTFKELDGRANQAARLLEARGIRPGGKIAMLLRNGREMIEIALGAQKSGVIAAPLNTWAKPKELKVTLDESGATLLFYDSKHAEQVGACDTEGIDLLYVGDEQGALEGSDPYEQQLQLQPSKPIPPFTRNRGAAKIVIHTSGTTGKPKGAQRNASAAGMGALANLLAIVPYRRDDVIVCPAPLFHSFGLATFTFATALGMTVVLPEKFDPEESLSLIEKHSATAASFVPIMIKRIVQLDDEVKKRYDLSSLRVVLASGSAMAHDLRMKAMDLFGEVLYDLYGSTEIGWAAIASPEAMKERKNTVGKAVRGIDIAVFSKEGDRLSPGETGELFIKSDILFEGYTSGDTKDERDGYMSIGDLGHVDEDGYLFIDGRADDMVVIGGENVYPIEVEELIESLDGVDEATVLGIEDEEYGQVLAAFFVGSTSESDIEKACANDLASFKVPRRIEKVDELPRTSTGKVLKRQLIERLDGAEPLDE